MKPWQRPVQDALEILRGKKKKQTSFEYYEQERHEYVTVQ